MADLTIHDSQAKHNESIAQRLKSDTGCYDWAVISAFYSALHFFEEYLFFIEGKHSENSVPKITETYKDGSTKTHDKYSVHAWRVEQIRRKAATNAYIAYGKLKTNSENVRYLEGYNWSPSPIPSQQYISQSDVIKMIDVDLQEFKKLLKIDFIKFLNSLQLENSLGVIAGLLKVSILHNFKDDQDFLANGKNIKTLSQAILISDDTIKKISEAIKQKGYTINW